MDQVPPHFHKEDRISEIDLIPDGNFVSEVPTWAAPEGTEVSFLSGSTFRRYKMLSGTWRQIGSDPATPFDPFAQFLEIINWSSVDGWLTSGTGAVEPKGSYLRITTAAGVANSEFAYSTEKWVKINESAKEWMVEWQLANYQSALGGGGKVYFFMEDGSTLPPTTENHCGFYTASDVWVTSTGNGSSQTTNTLGTALATGEQRTRLKIVILRGTNVKFYINDTLVATHTTNLPSTDSMRMILGVETGNATAREIAVGRVLIQKTY